MQQWHTCVCACVFMYFIVLAERLPHFLKLDLQLVTIALAELSPAHLLGGGEGMERIVEEEVVLLIQGVRGDVGDVSTTHLVRQAQSRALLNCTPISKQPFAGESKGSNPNGCRCLNPLHA